MEKFALTAQIRQKTGKGVARSLRRNDMVPAVLYARVNQPRLPWAIRTLRRCLIPKAVNMRSLISSSSGSDGADRMALIKDYEVDPISGKLIHVDLMEVALNEKVKIPVAVHITGASIGVKEGGIFQYGIRQLEIECLPNQIPDSIEVNISALKVNESLHVRDIKLAEGIRILTDPDATVATIQPPISDAKLEAMLTATPAAVTEGGEPELVKKPKKEGEAAAPAAEAKGKEGAPAKEAAAPKKEAAAKK